MFISDPEVRKDIQTQTYFDQVGEDFAHDIQVIEREDSNNVSIQISLKAKPTMRNNCSLTDVNGIEPQRSFSLENLRTGKQEIVIYPGGGGFCWGVKGPFLCPFYLNQ